jgi:hypothetical protein
MAGKIGTILAKKGTHMATKHFLDKQLSENSHRSPGGRWVWLLPSSLFPADPVQDPYFEYRPDKKGRMKKHRKQIPDYIPAHDAEILAKVRKWAYRLDVKMSFLGMRFGWAAIIGSIPEVGDALDVALSIYIYHMCRKVDGGLDLKTKSKMKAWIVTDGLIGTIPFIGDIIDVSLLPILIVQANCDRLPSNAEPETAACWKNSSTPSTSQSFWRPRKTACAMIRTTLRPLRPLSTNITTTSHQPMYQTRDVRTVMPDMAVGDSPAGISPMVMYDMQ